MIKRKPEHFEAFCELSRLLFIPYSVSGPGVFGLICVEKCMGQRWAHSPPDTKDCAYCGIREEFMVLEMDHTVPQARNPEPSEV